MTDFNLVVVEGRVVIPLIRSQVKNLEHLQGESYIRVMVVIPLIRSQVKNSVGQDGIKLEQAGRNPFNQVTSKKYRNDIHN
mgnify:CR=1 FL=1